MQIEKNNATQINQSSIQQSELKILKHKIELLQIVCNSFYSNQHRCVLSYIAAMTLQKQKVIRQEDVSIFANYASIMVDLRDGYFITTNQIFQKKQAKKDKRVTCYKLNTVNFFKIIRRIFTSLQENINKIKEFYTNGKNKQNKQQIQEKKPSKRCKKCHTIQTDSIKQFLGQDHCIGEDCRSTEFQDIVINQGQKVRIQKLTSIISIVFTKLKQIQDMEFKLQNKIQQIKQIEKDFKIKQIDRFMTPYENILKENGQKVEIQLDFRAIKQAQKKHAPLIEYQRVIQMRRARQYRQRSRQKISQFKI